MVGRVGPVGQVAQLAQLARLAARWPGGPVARWPGWPGGLVGPGGPGGPVGLAGPEARCTDSRGLPCSGARCISASLVESLPSISTKKGDVHSSLVMGLQSQVQWRPSPRPLPTVKKLNNLHRTPKASLTKTLVVKAPHHPSCYCDPS